jgi:hypothetical protein
MGISHPEKEEREPKSLITPLTYFFAIYSYLAFLGPLFFLVYAPDSLTFDDYSKTFYISLLYAGAVIFGWLVAARLGYGLVSKVLSMVCLGKSRTNYSPDNAKLWGYVFVVMFVASFLVTMSVSEVGFLWIEDSRVAYQFHRRGVGAAYALTNAFLALATVFSFFACGNRFSDRFKLGWFAFKTVVLILFSYFLGSKGLTLGLLVMALVYYNNCVKWVGGFVFMVGIGLALVSISILQFLQGTAESVEDTLLYASSFHHTAEFIRRFDEFGYQWGGAFISDLWSFVPRSVYPEKPYEYGQLLINQILFPGAAEQTSTPGLLPWAASYLDFGLLGVGASGIFAGSCYRWVYRFQVSRTQSILAFIILIQFGGFFPIFPYIPNTFVLFVIMPLLSIAVIRGTAGRERSVDSRDGPPEL